ncbi:hypothetical protein [Natrinema sp. 74]|uniref:hypothetical protein n=1 Tax=Natrinema sp. 74 TaxID=3384159 RepID=UPI0038D41B69
MLQNCWAAITDYDSRRVRIGVTMLSVVVGLVVSAAVGIAWERFSGPRSLRW